MRGAIRRFITIVAVAVTMVALGGSASAHQTVLDPDDSPGPLDLVVARENPYAVNSCGIDRVYCPPPSGWAEIHLRLVTYEPWESRVLGGPRSFVGFEFDLDDDKAADRCLVIRAWDEATPDALTGVLYRHCNSAAARAPDPLRVGVGYPVPVGRPDLHTATVLVTPQLIFSGENFLPHRWRAVTSFDEEDLSSPCAATAAPQQRGFGACVDVTSWKRRFRPY